MATNFRFTWFPDRLDLGSRLGVEHRRGRSQRHFWVDVLAFVLPISDIGVTKGSNQGSRATLTSTEGLQVLDDLATTLGKDSSCSS